jgi:hypothetical protein
VIITGPEGNGLTRTHVGFFLYVDGAPLVEEHWGLFDANVVKLPPKWCGGSFTPP